MIRPLAAVSARAKGIASLLYPALPAGFLSALLISPASAASGMEILFESPADGALVGERMPPLRLRVSNFQDLSDYQLKIEVAGLGVSTCDLDAITGIGNCFLSQNLQDGWQTISATLSDNGVDLAQGAISIAVDSDEDSVPNHEDSCANTSLQDSANEQGCALTQVDTDGDGISNAEELATGADPENPESFPAIEVRAFSAMPEQITRIGDSAGLSWAVQGASSVTLTNDANETRLDQLPSEGTAQVSPEFATTYTLQAEGPAGSTSAQIQVLVAEPQPQNLWGKSPLEQIPEAVSASLSVMDDGAVYLGAFDGNYYRFTPNGSLAWVLENTGIAMNRAAVSGSVAFVGTNGTDGGRILAVNADKSMRWELHMASGVIASPVLNSDASIVYAASYGGTVVGLRTSDGSEQWRYELPDGETVSATPTLSEDGSTLYVHSNNHQVFALNTAASPGGLLLRSAASSGQASSLIWQRDIRPKAEN